MRYVIAYEVNDLYSIQYVQLEEGESTCRDNILVNFWNSTDYLPEEVTIVSIEKVEVTV
jgi:hypothetical protein